jgi:hypothetical protein
MIESPRISLQQSQLMSLADHQVAMRRETFADI